MGNEFAHGEEVAEVDCLVELDVETFLCARHEKVGVEFLLQFLHLGDTGLQSLGCAAHTYVFPHDVSEFLVDRVDRTLTLDVEQTCEFCIHSLLCFGKLRQVGRYFWPYSLVGKVVLNSVRQNEISVGQSLHQCGCTEAVGSVVGEVALADSEEARDRGLQFVIYPYTTHCIVDCRINHHWLIVFHAVDFVGKVARIYVGDFFVHVEEVAVTLLHGIESEAVDTFGEVEEHGKTCVVDTESLVATLFGCTACHVARYEVTECRVAALQIVVAVFLGYFPAFLCACL